MKPRLILGWMLLAGRLLALEPPSAGELQRYLQDGSHAERRQFAERLGNHRLRAELVERALARLRPVSEPLPGAAPAPLPAWQGMPTKGTNQMLVVLIDFPDYPHVNEASTITNKLFGPGLPGEYPRESLRSYYLRSSYGQLDLQGRVLGWYRMAHERAWYLANHPGNYGNNANRAIIAEVVEHFDATHDFSLYDNNGDGDVDYLAVIWAGPDEGWGSFWWGYQWELASPVVADGVQFKRFSWQWESRPVGQPFNATVLIHETGHALGLPDYYDYNSSVGPRGGVGGLDMMDGNRADHCAFSKFMLEWLTPQVVNSGQAIITLRAMAQYPDALALMPGYAGATPYAEYFLVENRHRVQNDTGNPGNGILIWHVDARPDATGEDFLFNNSYTAHKLLRLMEADGLEEIETGDGRADAGDYYNQGGSFSPTTAPNSAAYSGEDTGVTITDLSADGLTMTLLAAIVTPTNAAATVVRVTATDADASEQAGNVGTWTVERTGPTNHALVVHYALSGTATPGADFAILNGTVTIPPGARVASITVTPINDSLPECPETVQVELLPNAAYLVGIPGSAVVTIADNDLPVVTLSVTDATAAEPGADSGTFTISRTGCTDFSLAVNFTCSGTALEGSDFVTLGNLVVIPAGAASAPVSLQPVDDALAEPTETVILTLAAGPGYTVGTAKTGTVNLLDDELPMVTISASDSKASEPGADAGTFTVTRLGNRAGPVEVTYLVSGTATPGADYAALSGTVTIPAHAVTATIPITPLDDAAAEPDETVIVTLAPGSGYTVGSPGSATVSMADDEVPVLTIAATDAIASEPGSDTGRFTVTRLGDKRVPLTVRCSVSGTATPGSDYVALPSVLTLASNVSTATILVTPVNDAVPEPPETVVLTLLPGVGYVVDAAASAAVVLGDDEKPTVTLVASDAVASEPGTDKGTFTVSRVGSVAASLVVYYTVGGTAVNGTDYSTLSGSVTISASATNAVITVTPKNDTVAEGSESVLVTLTANTAYTVGTPGSATVTIYDNDTPNLPLVTIAATDATASEPGSDPGTFTVHRTGSTAESLTVLYALSGTATHGLDYAPLSGTVTIPAGAASAPITVTPWDDTEAELTETVMATLTGSAAYNISNANHTATIHLLDNEAPVVTIKASDSKAAEPGSDTGTFTVTRLGSTAPTLTVHYTISGTATPGADYAALAGTVTLPANASTATIVVTPLNDGTAELDETVIVTLTPGSGYTVGAPNSATVTIADDEAPVLTLDVTDAVASEPGSDTGRFTVTRLGNKAAALTVNYSQSGTAVNGADYASLPGSVVLAANASSATITVTPLNDTVAELDETVTLTLASGSGYTIATPTSGTVTIADDETPTISIAATDALASEPGANMGTFTLTRLGKKSSLLTVNYTVGGTATPGYDYVSLGTSVRIAAGATNAWVTVTPLDDLLVEGAETVLVTLATGTGYAVGTPVSATVNIADDETSPGPPGVGRPEASWVRLLPARVADGHIHFTLLGEPGREYVIEQSLDLVNWQEWLTVADSTGWAPVRAPVEGSARFFRAKLKP